MCIICSHVNCEKGEHNMITKNMKIGVASGITVLGLALSLAAFTSANRNLNLLKGSDNPYELVLNSNNAVTTSGDHVIKTVKGADVTFTYSNVSSSTGNHTYLTNGGSIVNKDIIHSITTFSATFVGKLQARVAYTTDKWGEYFDLLSGQEISLGSNPYYLEMKANDGAVTLTNATYGYSCLVNPDAEEQDTTGSYDITFTANGSDSSTELTYSTIFNEVASGEEYIESFSGVSKVYAGVSGLKLGSSKASGNFTINFDSTTVTNDIISIDVSSAQYSTDTGSLKFYVNGSSTAAATIVPSEGGSFTVNAALESLEIETTTKRAYLCGLSLNYGASTTPSVPEADEVGFTASDSHKDDYSTNSIFATDNDLRVYAIFSDGTQTQLSAGEGGYSYTIKNSNNQLVDPSTKFNVEGTYLLTVSYKNYIPVEIELTVGEYIFIEAIAATSTKVTYNTADKLSDYLTGYVTAMVTYSDNSNSNVAYNNFEQNNLGLVLLNPKGITYTQTNPFGTAGTWTIRVYRLDDSSIKSEISITVNAIPVETITLSEASYEMYPNDTLQLTTTINPNTATNQVISWESSNESAVTVSDEGLVTAVSVGNATIIATAVDGSNVYATCTITVNERPASVSDTLTIETTGVTSGSTSYTSWSDKVGASGAVYAGQSAGQYGAIQLRSKNSNSGIVTTASGGTIGKISVVWNDGTTNGNSVNIYGKNTAYTDPTQLYTSASGELLGTIICGTSTEFVISGDYEYVGVRSYSGAVYLDSITFVWGDAGSSGTTQVYPTAIDVTGNNAIGIGETSELSVVYTPSNTNMTNVTWSTSNSSVAAVNSTGLVTGVAVGSADITATAKDENGNDITDTITVTVSPVAVTGVSLDSSSAIVKAGKTITLVPTISPSNATNKSVTWSCSDTSIATVSAGVVTGVTAGTATITVKTVDGNKTATCLVTVTNNAGLDENSITYTDLPTAYSTSGTVYTASSGIKFQAYNCANYSSRMQFKASSGYLQNTEALSLYSITINDRESNELTVYGSNTAGSFSTEITGVDDTYNLEGYNYFKVARTSSGAAYCSSISVVTGTPTPIDPTGISLSPSSIELAPGGAKTVDVTYTPANANQNKELTWTSSNTSVATVDTNGKITVKSTATVGQSATITATLNFDTTVKSSITVTVIEQQIDDQTIMIYMCGADLESGNGLASGDIYEILKVNNQPDDVNIIIETGGASSWSSSYGYGISSTKLERWHVENKDLVKDDSLSYASMGLTSTFQSFLEWGMTNYPADRMSVIMWNHGGAMRGVCYDEKKGDDCLLTDEVSAALSGAFNNTNRTEKLEWIGYDACLMQVQDIASINSDYFNYMIASEESEAGEGWDYDTWVDDSYAHKTTPVILKAIVDGFIADNGGTSSYNNDQTLSYLDLSYMSAYITAWDNMAAQLATKLTSSNKESFNNLVLSAKSYADSDYDYYGIFDAKDFVNKLANNSTFKPSSTYTDAVLTAHSNLVAYSLCGKGAGNSYGLCMFWACASSCSKSTYYKASMTKFTAWRSLVVTFGY